MKTQPKFYEFYQFSNGGTTDYSGNLAAILIIEANNLNQAIRIAKKQGVYFNGVDKKIDCPCCGDRWYKPTEVREFKAGFASTLEYIKQLQSVYGGKRLSITEGYTLQFETLEEYAACRANGDGYCIIYLNGTINRVVKNK